MSSNGTGSSVDRVTTTETTFEILEFLVESEGATLNELAAAFDLVKSTIHRHLATLIDMKYVVKEGDEYHTGLKFLQLSEPARSRKPGYRIARDKVYELVETTGERALFLVEEHGDGVYMYRAGGTPPFREKSMVGERPPLHALSSGKAILAQWEQDRLHEFIDRQELAKLTRHTITDKAELYDELDTVRERGYAVNDSEQVNGLRAVGVPVFGLDDELLGGLSVFGPTHRLNGEKFDEEIPELLMDTAHEIHVRLSNEYGQGPPDSRPTLE